MVNLRMTEPSIIEKGNYWVFRMRLPDGSRPLQKFRVTTPREKRTGKVESWRRYDAGYRQARQTRASMLDQKLDRKSTVRTIKVTFEQAIAKYEIIKSNTTQERTLKNNLVRLERFVWFMTDIKKYKHVDEVMKEDINEFTKHFMRPHYYKDQKEEALAGKTINSLIHMLNDLYELLMDDEYVEKNPIRKKRHLVNSIPNPLDVLSHEEALAILEVSKKKNKRVDWYAVYLTYLITGFRRDEVRKLKVGDVVFDAPRPYIHVKRAKGRIKDGYVQIIKPIHGELLGILKDKCKNKKFHENVFTNSRGKQISANTPRNVFMEIVKELGIDKYKHVSLHSFRKTFASAQYKAGVKEKSIQIVGAWEDVNVMRKSYIVFPEEAAVKEYLDFSFLHPKKNTKQNLNTMLMPQKEGAKD